MESTDIANGVIHDQNRQIEIQWQESIYEQNTGRENTVSSLYS